MGYILPVHHDTYRNYQYRMYKKDSGPYEVKGVTTVKFIPIQEEVDFYKQNEQLQPRTESGALISTTASAYKITSKEEEELSGKGRHVNIKV